MTTTTQLTQHDAAEACRNIDRAVSLHHHHDEYDLAVGRIDRPGSDFCGLCSTAFDDPRHGSAVRCGRKGRHVCKLRAS